MNESSAWAIKTAKKRRTHVKVTTTMLLWISSFAASVLMLGNASMVAAAPVIEVFHADSLGGPLQKIKVAFEAKHPGVVINLTSGRSKELAERIMKGDRCDLFASSSADVIEKDMIGKRITGTNQDAATWFVIFSANEMVIITEKGNPLGLRRVADLVRPEVRFVRVTGEKDLATNRTIEFLKRAAALEGKPELAQKIIDSALVDPSKPTTVPDTVRAIKEKRANAGVVYYSAAVASKADLHILRFPASINLSDQIQNAATVPGTARERELATRFVEFILSPEGRAILEETGQPPVVPPVRKGDVPTALK
jgi:molybdate/tungstate transport system substrate-binding protein